MPDIDALSDRIFGAVADYLGRSLKSFTDRLDATESKLSEFRQPADGKDGKDGRDGIDGKSVDHNDLAKHIAAVVCEEVAKIPKPIDGKDGKDGRDGIDGKSVDHNDLAKHIAAVVCEEVAKIPKPIDGKDGEPGKDGKDVDPETVAALSGIANTAKATAEDAHSKVMQAIAELAAVISAAKALPITPASFFIDDKGELVAVYPDGAAKSIGAVRGKDGTRGASIMDGSVNDSGQLVLRSSDGRLINVGTVRGEPGKSGETKVGAPGRDAADLPILPALDESKVYAEGTCAATRGGVLRAFRATDPVIDGDIAKAGWRAIMVGIAEETESLLDDGRYIERTTTYTDGRTFTRKEQTSTMIYRGIWADKDFARGDTVTWDGSLWHCEKRTKDKPGLSPDWKLVAKRGRDGKDSTKH